MPGKKDLLKVYLDTSVILPWFENIMANKKETPMIIQFLIEHSEIEKYISAFTIAELVENLMFKSNKIRDYMKKSQYIIDFIETFRHTIPNLKIIELEESKNGKKGLLISVPELIEFTSIIGSVKDSIHVCIAMHEDIYIVTKDDKVGKVQTLYPKIIGMIGFAKSFS